MMFEILKYMTEHLGIYVCLLAVSVLAAGCVILYARERRRARMTESSVEEEREFYRMFSKNNREFYMLIRKGDLRVLYVSPNFETMTGLDAGRVRTDIETLKQAVSRQTAREVSRRLQGWDGRQDLCMEMDYQVSGQDRRGKAVLQNDGENGYLLSFMDITEEYACRQQLEKDLLQANRESQAKSNFLSNMSHEIRTPMNGIIGMLNLARSHIKDRQTAEEYLTRAESLSQFLLTLINDILDMSRIESGKMELEEKPFDLFEVADKLNSMFKNTIEAKGITWELRMQDFDIRRVVGDELRLSQVIINFISNASKFTPAGGTVGVTFRQMNKIDGKLHLMIRVRDTGKGIKSDFISHLFRPFEQEDASTARNYGGSGLGMAIADNIVRLMNGQIIVESEEGKGTEFVVYVALPIAEGDQTVPDSLQAASIADEKADERQRAIDEFTLEGIHLLLAEDNDVNAEIAMELLEMEGAILERACDGEEAVRMFAQSEPGAYDAILMDIQMPNLDGWGATVQIRGMDRPDADLPIFAMSANAFVEDKRHSIEVGMNGHISKPVDFDEVRRVIAECLYVE